MKALKLLLAFAVILGVIVGAFWLPSMIKQEPTLIDIPDGVYSDYSLKFENSWAQVDDWNDSIFKQNNADVKALSDQNYQVDELREKNTVLAIGIVNKKVFEEWDKANCNSNVVAKYINALNTITSIDSSASSDSLIVRMRQVNATYREALNVANLSIGLSPGFNGSSWNSYANYANGIKQRRSAVLNNANYRQYLSNITSIKNGLNALDGKLSSGRNAFYSNLANAIISYYDRKERNYDNLGALRSVRNKFNNESSSDALNRFVDRFAREVDAASEPPVE